MNEADADDRTVSNAPWRNAKQKVFSSRGMVRAAQYCRLRSIQTCRQHPLPGTSSIMKCEDEDVEDVKTDERARAVGQMRFRFSSLSWLQRGGWTFVLWVCDQVVNLYHTHHPWLCGFSRKSWVPFSGSHPLGVAYLEFNFLLVLKSAHSYVERSNFLPETSFSTSKNNAEIWFFHNT